MGLFDFFKKGAASETKPLEEYLLQKPASTLSEAAISCFNAFPAPYASGCGVFCSTESAVKFLTVYFDRIGEKIPKCYYDVKLQAKNLFQMAYEKGSAEAAFYLAVLYEHGIGTEKNQGMANQYYAEASKLSLVDGSKSTGQYLTEAMEFVKNGYLLKQPELTDCQSEELAATIFFMNLHEDDTKNKIHEIFEHQDWLIDQFFKLGILLVCHYAEKGYPYSMTLLGSSMCSFEKDSEFFRQVFMFSSDQDVKKGGEILMNRCKQLAEAGNIFAQNVLTV